MAQCLGMLLAPCVADGGAIEPVLHVPLHVQQPLTVVEHAVEQVLVVEDDALGIAAVVVHARLRHAVLPPIGQIHQQDAGVEIRVDLRIVQPVIAGGLAAAHVLHRSHGRPGVQRRGPQRGDASPHHDVAVQIEHAVHVGRQDVGQETTIVGRRGKAAMGGPDGEAVEQVSVWLVEQDGMAVATGQRTEHVAVGVVQPARHDVRGELLAAVALEERHERDAAVAHVVVVYVAGNVYHCSLFRLFSSPPAPKGGSIYPSPRAR